MLGTELESIHQDFDSFRNKQLYSKLNLTLIVHEVKNAGGKSYNRYEVSDESESRFYFDSFSAQNSLNKSWLEGLESDILLQKLRIKAVP